MLKRSILVCTLALMIAGVSSCLFQPDQKQIVVPPPPSIDNLTQKEQVLTNMEKAYNSRRIEWYDGLLDPNFTFFLSTGDVGNGLPDQWDRSEELLLNSRLFNKNYNALPCQSIFMDIRTEDGLPWIEVDTGTEKWYKVTLHYDFKIEISPNTYIPLPDSQAEFTVRDAGPYGKYQHHWQLVQFRDLGGS